MILLKHVCNVYQPTFCLLIEENAQLIQELMIIVLLVLKKKFLIVQFVQLVIHLMSKYAKLIQYLLLLKDALMKMNKENVYFVYLAGVC